MPERMNLDFSAIDLESGFAAYTGTAVGISEKVLDDDLDTAARTGKRTRLLRLEPGTRTPEAHAHDYWEEIYIISGSMLVGTGDGGERRVSAPSYARREPGFMHGPVRADEPCLMIEFSWYPENG